ncbi:MAG: hypothetical protein DHS20C18_50140 [Saprospiraceae bacterium]|nr:MAG: hypothetical protein DHS20C18_50140 [Saprospiraceae bacterium]
MVERKKFKSRYYEKGFEILMRVCLEHDSNRTLMTYSSKNRQQFSSYDNLTHGMKIGSFEQL